MTGVTRRVDGRNGGHWYRLDGEKVDGVTTVIGNGVPKPAFIPWAAREVATFAVDNLDTISSLKRDEAIDLLKGAHYRERDRAARRGTEVHGYAEAMLNGEEADIPEELVGHVDVLHQMPQDFNIQPVLVEAVVGNRTHRWMGTIDLVADFNDGLRRPVRHQDHPLRCLPRSHLANRRLPQRRVLLGRLRQGTTDDPRRRLRRHLGPRRRLRRHPRRRRPRRLPHVPTRPTNRPVADDDRND